jgi:hypothetical protein
MAEGHGSPIEPLDRASRDAAGRIRTKPVLGWNGRPINVPLDDSGRTLLFWVELRNAPNGAVRNEKGYVLATYVEMPEPGGTFALSPVDENYTPLLVPTATVEAGQDEEDSGTIRLFE